MHGASLIDASCHGIFQRYLNKINKVLYLLICTGKGNLIHEYIIFVDPVFLSKRDMSSDNIFF